MIANIPCSRKCKLIHSDTEQISSGLVMGVGRRSPKGLPGGQGDGQSDGHVIDVTVVRAAKHTIVTFNSFR